MDRARRRAGRSLVYRSFPLDARNDRIRRALIIVHGTDRDAQGYFQVGLAAARLAGALDDTHRDRPAFRVPRRPDSAPTSLPHEVNWPCDGNSWRPGARPAPAP